MPRLGRNISAVLAVSLVFTVAFLAALGSPVGAQEGNATEGNATAGETPAAGANDTGGDAGAGNVRRLMVSAEEADCGEEPTPCWDIPLFAVLPGEQVEFLADFSDDAQPHNLHVVEPISAVTETGVGIVETLSFTFPTDVERVEFVCDVHPTTMVGFLSVPAALGAVAAEGEEVVEMGVHFLAYWVGVIAFAVLFIVYGITFFLFKYNETSQTTDHWDRSGAAGDSKLSGGKATLLAIVIGTVAIAAIIYVAQLG